MPEKLPSFAAIQEEIASILETYDNPENDLGEFDVELNEQQKAELDEYLEMLGTQESQKVDGFAQYLKMSEKQEKDLKEEAERLRKRAKSLENTRNYLTMRYLMIMERHGLKKISGKVYTMSRRATKVVQVLDEKQIPEIFWNEKITREPAKRDILAALKIGQEVPGCQIAESYSLITK